MPHYACGLPELVEYLFIEYLQRANALSGGRGAALHAASAPNHVGVAQLPVLLGHGDDVDVRRVRALILQFAVIMRRLDKSSGVTKVVQSGRCVRGRTCPYWVERDRLGVLCVAE